MKTAALLLLLAALASPAFAAGDKDKEKEKDKDKDKGYQSLFDSKDLTGWHPRRTDTDNAWKAEDGALFNDLKPGQHGTDLVSEGKYANFTVRYEYQVPASSNSGFYLRGRQEIQILGDWKEGQATKTGDGSIYNFKAPDVYAADRNGGWNTVEATVVGNRVTVTINGKKVHDNVECAIATGGALDLQIGTPGPIMLQGDHGAVKFRNIRIKELPAG